MPIAIELRSQDLTQLMEPIQYAGFPQRFAAGLLDWLIVLPYGLLTFWAQKSRLFSIYCFVPSILFSLLYEVYLVRRWGGTPGKLIMSLRILKVNGEPVGYREAFLRAAPDLILGALLSAALIAASFKISASEYNAIPWLQRVQRLAALAPPWYRPLDIAQKIWIWGELVVLLTNRKRRALHDFMAGTIVAIVRSKK